MRDGRGDGPLRVLAEAEGYVMVAAPARFPTVLSRADFNKLALCPPRPGPAALPVGTRLPYPWCRHPTICSAKGYCPRDPNCGE